MSNKLELEATKEFSQGNLNEHNECDLKMAISIHTETGKVIVDFGSPLSWIGMEADDALQLALIIKQRALLALDAKGDSPTVFIRASGDVVCEECGDTYYHHPRDMRQLSDLDLPFLRVLCDGRRVKL
jgi:hypothetical protein